MTNLTPTRTIIRLDYYGQPYEATVVGRQLPDRGELWSRFLTKTKEQREWERKVYVPGQHQELNREWFARESYKVNRENEKV